ncbi:hypothetical protein ACC680_37060, partial [Rhizobium ruizarguesonis]
RRRLRVRHKFSADVAKALSENRQLAGLHAGQRCFILGNGPSVNDLDLSRLQGENVVTVSSGYHQSVGNLRNTMVTRFELVKIG